MLRLGTKILNWFRGRSCLFDVTVNSNRNYQHRSEFTGWNVVWLVKWKYTEMWCCISGLEMVMVEFLEGEQNDNYRLRIWAHSQRNFQFQSLKRSSKEGLGGIFCQKLSIIFIMFSLLCNNLRIITLKWAFHIYIVSGSIMLHCHVSTRGQPIYRFVRLIGADRSFYTLSLSAEIGSDSGRWLRTLHQSYRVIHHHFICPIHQVKVMSLYTWDN